MKDIKFEADYNFFKDFEDGLDTLHPEKSSVPFEFTGYGEISTVISFRERYPQFVFKRIPIFDTEEQAKYYDTIYREYSEILRDAKINIPWQDGFYIKAKYGYVYFNVQEKLPSHWMGHKVLFSVTEEEVLRMLDGVLYEYKKVFEYKKEGEDLKLGIDGQISNWAVKGYEMNSKKLPPELNLLYIDTGTPLYRKNGVEMLQADLFLKSIPFGLRKLVKKIFLQEILDRYYIMRFVIIDMLSNIIKEGKKDILPEAIARVNKFLKEEYLERPITIEEIISYYRRDTFIWNLFLRLRKAERFIKKKILRTHYEFLLYDVFIK